MLQVVKYTKIMKNLQIINTIKPNVIVHLAGISSSVYAFNNPIKTLEANGMFVAKICETIHQNKLNCKLFNASSSEIFKGHKIMTVEDDNKNYNHLHPYSIAKIMGQNIIRFYRENYNLHFSNGILFTTQSIEKSNNFLLNKIYDHLKNNNENPLKIGNIESYRNIIHPFDVVNAIKYILKADKGDDYNICNYNSYKIKDLVFKLYSNFGFELIKGDEEYIYYDKNTNKPLLIIENNNNGLDKKNIDIKGCPVKLKNLNWYIQYSIDDIMNEFK